MTSNNKRLVTTKLFHIVTQLLAFILLSFGDNVRINLL